jgi:aromatic-L-amino-acid decarboxylase
VAPSSTTIDGVFAIRAALVNHRTATCDIDVLVEQTLAHGRRLTQCAPTTPVSEVETT